jgi:hypothetical protein
MTLMLDLPPDLEQVLLQTAQEKGVSLEALALQVLTNSIADRQVASLIPPEADCEIWSPYEAFEAAETMMRVLQKHEEGHQ